MAKFINYSELITAQFPLNRSAEMFDALRALERDCPSFYPESHEDADYIQALRDFDLEFPGIAGIAKLGSFYFE